MRPASRTDPKKVMQKLRNQTNEYYAGWVTAEKEKEHRNDLYNHSIKMLVDVVKEKNELKNRPVEIREVIKPVEVIKEIKVPYEVVKEIPVEKIVEIPITIEKQVIVEVPVIKEIIKKVEVPVEVEVIKEVPYEVIKEVPKEVFVTDKEEVKRLRENFETRLKLAELSKKALERRYQASLLQARELGKKELMDSFEGMEIASKKYKRLFTYAYITTMVALPTFLGLIVCGKYLF